MPETVRLSVCSLLISFTACLVSVVEAADVYVHPDGNDAWLGTHASPTADGTNGPMATLAAALARVRTLRAEQPQRGTAVVIELADGFYPLPATLQFTPQDSGTQKSPTVIQAANGAAPVLSGGTKITGWQVSAEGHWRVTLPQVTADNWRFAQLFVNDQRRFRPRLPKQGYYRVAESLDPSPAAQDKGFDRFRFAASDLQGDWSRLREVEVLGFHQWSASRMRIESIDPATRIAQFTGCTAARSHWMKFANGARYRVENVKEALREPGEWYLDCSLGELTYLPLSDESPTAAVVVAPRLSVLLDLRGDPAQDQWVEHIQFRGLTFAHANWILPEQGQSIVQAEFSLPAAIEARGAQNLRFDDCTVRQVGGYAMAIEAACRHVTVESCNLLDLGAGGIKIGTSGGEQAWNNRDVPLPAHLAETSHITLHDCTLACGGRLHPAAVGVWLGHATYCTITHNELFDFYYTGISMGWQWGYAPSSSHHHSIAFNHIHTIGQGVLSDMGGVYTLGISPGTTVSSNKIHDVKSFGYGGWGLYTDAGSSDIVMENNLVYRTQTGGFHQHYGRDNRIVNNIFAFAYEHQLQRTQAEEHRSFIFERNIVYWDNASPLFATTWRDPGMQIDHNLYWNAHQQPLKTFDNLTLDAWCKTTGHDKHSLEADPLFEDPQAGDFRVRPDSPALQVGFVPFNASQAGRKTKPRVGSLLPPVPKAFD